MQKSYNTQGTTFTFNLTNGCYRWDGYNYVEYVSGPSCSTPNTSESIDASYTQGDAGHGWFKCHFNMGADPNCGNPFLRHYYDLYMDVYASGSYVMNFADRGCS